MNYEVKSRVPQGGPFTKKVNGIETYGVSLVITAGVSGQKYPGFTTVDQGTDTFCPILRTDNTDQAEVKFTAFATNYVATKYPNY